MDFLYNLLPHLLNGIALGLLFALVALGFMLIVGVMEVINLAHGSLFALGAYVALVFIEPGRRARPFGLLRPIRSCRSAGATSIALMLRAAPGRRSSAWGSSSACGAPTARTRSTACC